MELRSKSQICKITIITVYNNKGISQIKEELENNIFEELIEDNKIIITGDFKARKGTQQDERLKEWQKKQRKILNM